MADFLRYSLGLFYRPQAALRALAADRRRVLFGFLGQLILAAVYIAGISLALALGVMHLPEQLVLNIPANVYYSYERLFILPAALAGTILASGVIRLLAPLWDGRGQFEDLFALLGFAGIAIAVLMGLPDLVLKVLVRLGIIAQYGWTYVGPHVWLGTLWFLVLMVLSVREVERLPWGKTVVLALAGFAVNGAVQSVFMR